MTDHEDLGAQFRARRLKLGLQQTETARRAGVEQATLFKFERGLVHTSSANILAVARVLGTRLTLVPRDQENKSEEDLAIRSLSPVEIAVLDGTARYLGRKS